ncbi:MAG TPA: desulfoferrodoxin [Candidatus Caccousia avistercoris]|nr:desulfoferrodoxin [Candidatus Caccousia avistercoris]
MKDLKFYLCSHCKNLVEMIHFGGAPLMCCGEKMQLLTPNTTEAATEKHIPVAQVSGNTVSVTVGSVEHPMLEEHYIMSIFLETEKTVQRCDLTPGQKPAAVFAVAEGDKPVAVYAYCNLHGLWKAAL